MLQVRATGCRRCPLRPMCLLLGADSKIKVFVMKDRIITWNRTWKKDSTMEKLFCQALNYAVEINDHPESGRLAKPTMRHFSFQPFSQHLDHGPSRRITIQPRPRPCCGKPSEDAVIYMITSMARYTDDKQAAKLFQAIWGGCRGSV